MAILPGAIRVLEQARAKTKSLEDYLQRLRDERDRKHREEFAARLEALKGSIEHAKPIPWSEVKKNFDQLGPFLSGQFMQGGGDAEANQLPGRGGSSDNADPFDNKDDFGFDLPDDGGAFGDAGWEGSGGEFGGGGASSTFETLMGSTGSTFKTLMASTGSAFETLMGATAPGLSSSGGSWEGGGSDNSGGSWGTPW